MARIDDRTKQQILTASKGVFMDVVKKYDTTLKHVKGDGKNYDRGRCPKCGASDALVINTVKEAYFCKGCNFKGYGAASYLYNGVHGGDKSKWEQTLRILADFTNTVIP